VELTQDRLQQLFNYDPQTGAFTRRVKTCNSIPIDSPVGAEDRHGYRRVKIDRKSYFLHRLAWLYVYGVMPTLHIDHINGMVGDNRIANLREVTREMNLQNQRRAQRGTRSGLLGAYPNGRKWRAAIQTNGVYRTLGNFDTAEEAHAAYLAAKRTEHATCTI